MSASEGERFANDEDVGENNINPPTLIGDDDGDDDDNKSLLVGATICFTPEPSPRSTPLKSPAKRAAALDLTPIELESAMSSNATSSDAYIGSIVDGSKVSTNVIHSSSSLDGKSTTEYEILDKLLTSGVYRFVDKLFIEFHPHLSPFPPEVTKEITQRTYAYFKDVDIWDSSSYSIVDRLNKI